MPPQPSVSNPAVNEGKQDLTSIHTVNRELISLIFRPHQRGEDLVTFADSPASFTVCIVVN